MSEDLLARVALFAGLDRVDLAKLAAYLEPLEVAAGAEVFRQGDPADSLYVVAEGVLAAWVASGDAHGATRVGAFTRGDVFGEMALVTGEPRSATIRAERPSTILQLPRERFLALVRREPTISLTIAATLSDRLRAANAARVEHAAFAAAAVDEALGRLPAERRRALLDASLLDAPSSETLRVLFGDDANTVADDIAALGAGAPARRALREALEREVGGEPLAARAETLAARLTAGGRWHDALALLARASTPAVFGATLGRALRALPPLDADLARHWVERVDDAQAARDADLALARAQRHEARGDVGAALALLRRALGVALVDGEPAAGRRLSSEIARLGSNRTVDVSGAPPGLSTAAGRRWGAPALACVGAAAACVAAGAWPGATPAWSFVWLLLAAIALLMSRAVPDFAVGLVLVTAWLVLGVATMPQALAGFATREWLFVVAIYGLAAATARSGLLFRIGLLLVRRLPHGMAWQTGTLLATGVLLTPLLPSSTGRASLTSPLALAVAEALRLPDRGRAAALLGLGTWVGAGPLMFAFLNGSGTCLLAWGLLPEASRARFGWIGWSVATLPLTGFVVLGSLVVLALMYRPEPVARLGAQRVSLQVAALGPVTPREIGTIVILALTVAGWIAAPWLHVELATVAVFGLLACVGLGTLDRAALQSLDWGFLLFFGVVLSVGRLGVSVGLDRVVGASVDHLLGAVQPGPLALVLAVAALSVLVRLALDQDLAVVLLALTLLPVATRLGVEPWLVVIALLATSVAWFLPSQTPSYLVAQAASEGRLFSHAQAQRFAVAYTALTLLGLALCIPYWRLLGLI